MLYPVNFSRRELDYYLQRFIRQEPVTVFVGQAEYPITVIFDTMSFKGDANIYRAGISEHKTIILTGTTCPDDPHDRSQRAELKLDLKSDGSTLKIGD